MSKRKSKNIVEDNFIDEDEGLHTTEFDQVLYGKKKGLKKKREEIGSGNSKILDDLYAEFQKGVQQAKK
jgi:hypothetical protein